MIMESCLLRRVPPEADPRLWLYVSLGPRRFRTFQRKFGGRRVLIPKYPITSPCHYCPYRTRHMKILRKKGLSPSRIARRFGLSTKHVYALLKERDSSLPES